MNQQVDQFFEKPGKWHVTYNTLRELIAAEKEFIQDF